MDEILEELRAINRRLDVMCSMIRRVPFEARSKDGDEKILASLKERIVIGLNRLLYGTIYKPNILHWRLVNPFENTLHGRSLESVYFISNDAEFGEMHIEVDNKYRDDTEGGERELFRRFMIVAVRHYIDRDFIEKHLEILKDLREFGEHSRRIGFGEDGDGEYEYSEQFRAHVGIFEFDKFSEGVELYFCGDHWDKDAFECVQEVKDNSVWIVVEEEKKCGKIEIVIPSSMRWEDGLLKT